MGDLEETIFQRNVPGKYSKWEGENKPSPEDNVAEENGDSSSEGQGSDDMALLRYAEQLSRADVPEPIRQRILADRAGAPATGVKGVLADYKAATAMALAEAQAEALARQQIITRMVEGAKVKTSTEIEDDEQKENGLDSDEDEDLLGDYDDAFMREFRAKRLQEMKASQQLLQGGQNGGDSSSRGAAEASIVFGTVREIRSEDFLSEIDGADPRVVVVLHLYEPAVQGCVRMNGLLQEVAATTFPGIKFLRMQASSNQIEVDRVALPVLTIYRGGREIGTIAGIAADFGQYFTKKDVEWLLQTSMPQDTVSHSKSLPGRDANW